MLPVDLAQKMAHVVNQTVLLEAREEESAPHVHGLLRRLVVGLCESAAVEAAWSGEVLCVAQQCAQVQVYLCMLRPIGERAH